jgi:basic amino acid/polyamine antiporter, APA family
MPARRVSSSGKMTETTDTGLEITDPVVADEHSLNRALSAFDLTLIGIGSVIGAGIFVVAGTAAAQHAGPAVVISFLIAALGCFLAGLCYAEFASMIPHAGSSYTYTYATMGRFMAWFIGWNMVLEYGVAGSGVAVGWSAYFVSLLNDFGIHFPAALANAPLGGADLGSLHATGAIINLPAFLLVLALTWLLVIGVRETARFNGIMVVIKVSVVLMVILLGLPYVTAGHLTPFIPPNEGHVWGKYGISGILAASGIIFFAYVGFETVSVAAQEARRPQRDIPSAILLTLVVCTILYVLMAVVLTGITDWRSLDVANPVSFAISKIPALHWLTLLVNIGALSGLASVTFATMYGQSRVFYGMARDNFLPPAFAAVHPRYRTPHWCTIIIGVVAAVLGAIFPLDILADLVSIGTLLAFIAVCAGVMMVRINAPRARRPFKTPLVWLVAPGGIAVCGLMMVSLSNGTWIRLVVWTAIGLAIYFGYSRRHAAPSKWTVKNQD